MRTVRFRGKKLDGKWIYGFLNNDGEFYLINGEIVKEDTIGQYTNIDDKDENCIYEGDIVEYWAIKYSFDTAPYNYCLGKIVDVVGYNPHTAMYEVGFTPLSVCGLKCIDDAYPYICNNVDINGNEPNDEIIGIRVIGNIYDNIKLSENE